MEVTCKVARAVIMLIIAVSLGAAGQMCLKYGVNLLGQGASPVVVLKGIFTPYVFSGFVLYAVSSLFYLIALSRLELSFAYPFVALSFVIVLLLSWMLLHEQLPPLRVVGVAFIVIGVLTVAGSYRAEAKPEAAVSPTIEQPQ